MVIKTNFPRSDRKNQDGRNLHCYRKDATSVPAPATRRATSNLLGAKTKRSHMLRHHGSCQHDENEQDNKRIAILTSHDSPVRL